MLGCGAVLLDWKCLVPELSVGLVVLGTGAVLLDWVCFVLELSVGQGVLGTEAVCWSSCAWYRSCLLDWVCLVLELYHWDRRGWFLCTVAV